MTSTTTDRWKLLTFAGRNGLLNRLDGHAICVTGTLSVKRVEIEELVQALGGVMHSQVKQSTTYLLIPAEGTVSSNSKYIAATRAGVNVINEEEFCEMILPTVEQLLSGGRHDGSEHGSKA